MSNLSIEYRNFSDDLLKTEDPGEGATFDSAVESAASWVNSGSNRTANVVEVNQYGNTSRFRRVLPGQVRTAPVVVA